ncbi:acyl transferase/acyl hydrolase/lysophospholipase [Flagelloscypha sp. PMI_526]|nr:acyl transferase/acyl hydrolase/lysophospholipase [Flagelloscypha sp. PMI_526]
MTFRFRLKASEHPHLLLESFASLHASGLFGLSNMTSTTTADPVTLLALDSGGIRGLVEAELLHEVMYRLQFDRGTPELPKPGECFDLIGGSGTGGLFAVLLGPLQLGLEEARDYYLNIINAAFSRVNGWPRPPEQTLSDPPHLVPLLKDIVADLLGDEDARMIDPARGDKCKVMICLNMIHTHPNPRLIRNYETASGDSTNYRIWDVLRATLSCPGVLSVFDPETQTYTDMDMPQRLYSSNPSSIVLDEAFNVFPERKLSCLVNVGTGFPGLKESISPIDDFVKTIGRECERAADEMTQRTRELLQSETEVPPLPRQPHGIGSRDVSSFYYRLNVLHGMEGFEHTEWELQRIHAIKTHVNQCFLEHETTTKIDDIIGLSIIGRKPRIVLRKREDR